MEYRNIENLVVELSKDSFNPVLNFNCAVEYEKLNQGASAVSFYLRAAEYGVNTHREIVYASLLKISKCFDNQKDRQWNVTNYILHALAYAPERPEAYLLMSKYFERDKAWQECYTWAEMGLNANSKVPNLPVDVGYPGKYSLLFQKAVSSWWIGRREESKNTFIDLLDNYEMSQEYISSCLYNLEKI